jgi:hypothetical protein
MFKHLEERPGAANATNTLDNGGCADFAGAGFGPESKSSGAVRLNSTREGRHERSGLITWTIRAHH